MPGELKKMKITAYQPPDNKKLSENPADTYLVLVNPENYVVNYRVNYDYSAAAGSAEREPKYYFTPSPTMQFEFLFDSTGIIPKPLTGIAGALSEVPIAGAIAGAVSSLLGNEEKYDIIKEIDKFKRIVLDYSSTIHSPRKLQLLWGTLLFDAKLTSLDFTFKLFAPDGTPIRAVAKAGFVGSLEDNLAIAKQKKSSPDLTHVRVVKEGDTLPQMAHNIYGDSSLYLEVARVNNLTNFRKLKPGDTIYFPPVNKI